MKRFVARKNQESYVKDINKSGVVTNKIDQIEIIISIIIVLIITFISVFFLEQIPKPLALLLVTIVMSGAAGGILYAVRDSTLEWPKVTGGEIHLGWIADTLYGISGAFAVCLIVPNFSESAINGFSDIVTKISKENSNSADLIEIIAVSIVGGFAGRSVLRMASDKIIKKELQEMNQKVEATKVELDQRLENYNNDTMVSTMISRHLSNGLTSDQIPELRALIVSSSESVRTLAIKKARSAFINNPSKDIANRVKEVFEMLKEGEQDTLDHQLAGYLAEVYEFLGDYDNALKNIEQAINIRDSLGLKEIKVVSSYEELKKRVNSLIENNKDSGST